MIIRLENEERKYIPNKITEQVLEIFQCDRAEMPHSALIIIKIFISSYELEGLILDFTL